MYLVREVNTANPLEPKLNRRQRAAWEAFKDIEDVVGKAKNIQLRVHLFDSAALPAALQKQDENAISVTHRGIERTMLGEARLKQVKNALRVARARILRCALARCRDESRRCCARSSNSMINWERGDSADVIHVKIIDQCYLQLCETDYLTHHYLFFSNETRIFLGENTRFGRT
ncbi:unnamed protein product [Heligmosomoides polygyrus]|uniref:Transposase n=1 Tax=Heligmosomoides polygyrus TaxID=6339 RepID=A0A183GE19_HELPZ|nr:unnamed protein product [Heligmosomoides polygyrus]